MVGGGTVFAGRCCCGSGCRGCSGFSGFDFAGCLGAGGSIAPGAGGASLAFLGFAFAGGGSIMVLAPRASAQCDLTETYRTAIDAQRLLSTAWQPTRSRWQ